jgi:hypothetical protein
LKLESLEDRTLLSSSPLGSLAATSTTLITSAPQPNVGQQVTFTASVTDQAKGGPAPTGQVAFMDGTTVLKTVSLDNTGKATYSTAFTTAGTHAIKAKYLGDAATAASAASVNEQVAKTTLAATATALAAAPAQAGVGQTVTFTATVTDQAKGGPAPTGMVAFMQGTNVLKTVALDKTGKAVFTTAFATAGNFTITAKYLGDAATATSSAAVHELVARDTRAATATALAASPTQGVVPGQDVTFTATVTDQAKGGPAPTGMVAFMQGTTVLQTVAVDNTGKATYTTSFAAAGKFTITAKYQGDTHTLASTALVTTQVGKDTRTPTTTTLAASPGQPTVGQPITFTATVTDPTKGGPVPTGMVQFYMDGAKVQDVSLDAKGNAVLAITPTTAGHHVILAKFLGDAKTAISSASVTEQVAQNTRTATTTTLAASPAQGVSVGQNVTFTATVTDPTKGGPAPTGQVAFMQGTTVLKTVALDKTGKAVYTTSFATAGKFTITAKYLGDTHTSPSSASVAEQVATDTRSATTTALAATPAQAGVGQTVTFTATVTDQAKGGPAPTGQVAFMQGTTVLKTVALDNTGKAVYTTSFAAAGKVTITARYLGDAHTAVSSATITEQVATATGDATTTALTASPTQAGVGQTVTFTAAVTDQTKGGPAPTGQVAFMEGTTVLKTVALDNTGKAVYTTSFATAGSQTITAKYLGDAHTAVSSATTAVQVTSDTHPATQTVWTSVNVPTVINQNVIFTVKVTPTQSNGGTPTGQVTFMEGTTVLGTATIDNTGQATLSYAFKTAGKHNVIAQYAGNNQFAASTSKAIVQEVDGSHSVTILEASAATIGVGQNVTLTATVKDLTPGAVTPTGQVTFMDGTTVLKTVPLDATGNASFQTVFSTAGAHKITANYSGDGHSEMSSAFVTEQVNAIPPG